MKSENLSPLKSYDKKNVKQNLYSDKQPLKAKSFIFSRTHSMKLEKKLNRVFDLTFQQGSDEKPFVPKLKSKQLLRQPKFFFSLQRKKVKNQNSEPSFQAIKCQNPQMRGSKAKSLYTKILLARNQSFKEFQNDKKGFITRNLSFDEKISSCSNQVMNTRELFHNQKLHNNLLGFDSGVTTLQRKASKRPNLYENISFLIRRKRDIKNKSTLNKISNSKHYMTQVIKPIQDDKN